MDALLFAAGLGTRLRPLTDHTPKALVPVGGAPILERVARRVIAAGADRLIVNTHHLGEQIERYVEERGGWGVEVLFSREPEAPLETGGGLLRAAPLFRRDAPFLAHNADILTDFPLREMYAAHLGSGALATLAVMERPSSRQLLFDDQGLLGRVDQRRGLDLRVRPAGGEVRRLAFGGVHVISPEIFSRITETGVFSILDPYLRLAAEGERILPFRTDGSLWLDIGRPEQLEEANRVVAERALS
ncbi:MAG TPA: nucleotidyltransferase family protein [Longimicrobiaceae bacterium]|nr:nucleotidyltransferase family protein [Longimicrobiaceae bacterium]